MTFCQKGKNSSNFNVWERNKVHCAKTLQIINYLIFGDESPHVLQKPLNVLKKPFCYVGTYDLLLPTGIKRLKIFFHKI